MSRDQAEDVPRVIGSALVARRVRRNDCSGDGHPFSLWEASSGRTIGPAETSPRMI
jgi:hypothetical protein